MIEKIIKDIERLYTEAKKGVENLKQDSKIEDFKQLYNLYVIVKKASNQFSLSEFKHFESYSKELMNQSEQKFETDVKAIIDSMNSEEGMSLEALAAL